MTTNGNGSKGDHLQHTLNVLVLLVIGIIVWVLVVPLLGFWYVSGKADTNTEVMCAIRGNFERRIASTEEFLANHPEGFAGVSADVLAKDLAEQRETVAAMSALDCPPNDPLGIVAWLM